MTDLAPIDADCPATWGREASRHSWIEVTRSSTRPVPYTMCSKCGITALRAIASEQEKG